MEFSVKQIAAWLQGSIEGDDSVMVNSLSKIEEGKAGSLSFLANGKYTSYLYTTSASAVIISKDLVLEKSVDTCLIRVEEPYSAFATLLNAYSESRQKSLLGISALAFIHETSKYGEECYIGEFSYLAKDSLLGNNCKVYPNCYIGSNVKIGNNCILFPGVKIYEDCIIGDNCTLHAGVVIGADGFGFAPQSDNQYKKVAQIGNVIIEDYVEIGANATIDRATMGSTIIHKGVKLDNLIQVAHNVEIGENTVIAAQSGIAGSTKIGKNCMIGGQVAIAGHLTIGDGVKIAGGAGVGASIKANEVQMGAPAFAHKSFLQSYVFFRKLPDLAKKIDELEKSLKSMKENAK